MPTRDERGPRRHDATVERVAGERREERGPSRRPRDATRLPAGEREERRVAEAVVALPGCRLEQDATADRLDQHGDAASVRLRRKLRASIAREHDSERRPARKRRDRERRNKHEAAARKPAGATQHVVPIPVLLVPGHELLEPLVHVRTSSSACRSVARAALSVAPTVPGLIASASAIAA